MSNANRVGSNTPDSWQYYRIGFKAGVPLGVTANAVATIPILSGGLTSNVGGNYIVRRITARNPSGTVAAANVAIAGPISGQIVSTQGFATISGAGKYKDFTISSSFVNSSNVTVTATVDATTQELEDSFLYVNVLAAAAANNTVDISVFGELVIP